MPVPDRIAPGTGTVAGDHFLLIRNTQSLQVLTFQPAQTVNTGGQVVWQTVIGQIGQWVPQSRQLPVKYGNHFRLPRRQHEIAETEVAMGNNGFIAGGQMFRQPRHKFVHGRQVMGFRCLILPAPAHHLPGHIPFRTAEVAEPCVCGFYRVQCSESINGGMMCPQALPPLQRPERRVTQNPALKEFHDVERRANDRRLLAEGTDPGHRNAAVFTQRLHHPVLPFDHVCRWQGPAGGFFRNT